MWGDTGNRSSWGESSERVGGCGVKGGGRTEERRALAVYVDVVGGRDGPELEVLPDRVAEGLEGGPLVAQLGVQQLVRELDPRPKAQVGHRGRRQTTTRRP